MPDISPLALAKQDNQFRNFLKKLAYLNKDKLSRDEQISLLIQQRQLQNDIDLYQFNAHYMPLTSESSFHSGLAFFTRSSCFKTLNDYQNYLSRLEQFPLYFEQQINWMRKGIQTGFIQPKVVLKGFEDSVKAFIKNSPEDSVFYAPFKNYKDANVDLIQKQKLTEHASLIVAEHVFGAYQTFYNFLVTEYIPKSKSNIAAKSLPNGIAYYQNRSDFYTTTQMSVHDIHFLSLEEVNVFAVKCKQSLINSSLMAILTSSYDIYGLIKGFMRKQKAN